MHVVLGFQQQHDFQNILINYNRTTETAQLKLLLQLIQDTISSTWKTIALLAPDLLFNFRYFTLDFRQSFNNSYIRTSPQQQYFFK
jgi:hypothetical protein